MPPKKYKYTTPIQFFPRSSNDLLKDDPTESQNIIVPLEPEEFRYGVYFNDGYDYMQHLISKEEFFNEEFDLQENVKQNKKCNMMPSQPTKSAVVVKEFEIDEEGFDDKAIEKLKEISKNEIDEDILKALDSDSDISELEDDFVELANTVNMPSSITGDRELFHQFLGNDYQDEDEEMIDDDSKHDISQAMLNVKNPKRDINFEKEFNEMEDSLKSGGFGADMSTHGATMSMSFLNTFNREKEKNEKKQISRPIDNLAGFFENMYKGETDYVEEDVEQAVDQWAKRTLDVKQTAFDVVGKVSKHQPIVTSIPTSKERKRRCDKMESEVEEDFTITDVSQFHIPRPVDETSEDKKERKKAIKNAKRTRKEEKKIIKETFKNAKRMA